VLEAIEAKHPDIAHLFWTGIGPRVHRIDSEIILQATLRLFRQHSITAWMTHDSLTVPRKHIDITWAVMRAEFRKRCPVYSAGLLEPAISIEIRHPDGSRRFKEVQPPAFGDYWKQWAYWLDPIKQWAYRLDPGMQLRYYAILGQLIEQNCGEMEEGQPQDSGHHPIQVLLQGLI
jgi:hypothetical protein